MSIHHRVLLFVLGGPFPNIHVKVTSVVNDVSVLQGDRGYEATRFVSQYEVFLLTSSPRTDLDSFPSATFLKFNFPDSSDNLK